MGHHILGQMVSLAMSWAMSFDWGVSLVQPDPELCNTLVSPST